MPKVDLIATRSFVYGTRRLQAEEPFQARNAAEAGVLVDLAKKARYGRVPGEIAPPPKAVADKIEAAVVPPSVKPKRTYRKRATKKS